MKKKEPTRLKGVPPEAVYDPEAEEWGLGATDKKGRRTGEWKFWWPSTGHLCGVSVYEKGGTLETFTRYHPDGTFSSKGVFLNDEPIPNTTYVMQKSKHKTTELALLTPEYKNVFRMEELFIRKGLSKWKNFDRAGRRIDLDGEPLLDPETYAKNFTGFELPAMLSDLVELQNQLGAECYCEGFALGTDDKLGLARWSKKPQFLSKLMTIGSANGTGSDYCFWDNGTSRQLDALPVVIFGDEGGVHVVAQNVAGLLQILSADLEPSVTWEGVSFYRGDTEPSEGIGAFRTWLKAEQGIAPSKKPEAIVMKAQAALQASFSAWLKPFVRVG